MVHRNSVLTHSAMIALALLTAAGALGDQPVMTPVAQARSTSAFVIVPPCGPPATVSDNDAAGGFGPFDSLSSAVRECDFAGAHATGSQNSQIGAALLNASGDTDVDAAAAMNTVIHSIAFSVYDVTFDVNEAGRFRLSAALSAAGGLPVIGSFARVTLRDGAGAVIIQATVDAPPDGSTIIGDVWQTLRLEAGRYTLRVEAQSGIDATVPPAGAGAASYGMSFESLVHGDVNGDGAADVSDLLALLKAWGPCPVCDLMICPADLNGDCDVDVSDLLILLANWS